MARTRCLILLCFVLVCGQSWAQSKDKALLENLQSIDVMENDSAALQALQSIGKVVGASNQLELNKRIILRANSLQKFNDAIAAANESIVLSAQLDSDSMEAYFNKLLGTSYYYMDQRKASVPYFEQAVQLASKNGYWELEASCYNNIGGALADVQEYEASEPNLLKSIEIMNQHGMENAPATLRTYRVLARMYGESGRPEMAEPIYQTLIVKSKENKDTALLADILLFYSEMLTNKGNASKAVEMSGQALGLLRLRKNEHELVSGLTIHCNNLTAVGRHQEAYALLQEANWLMRKVFASNLEHEVSEMEVKYKTAQIRQEKELAELKTKKQRQVYLFSFAGVLLLLGSGGYVWNQQRTVRQKTARQTELAAIEKQRFKDVLEAEEKERTRIARELHDGLGQMLSTARLNVSGLSSDMKGEEAIRVKSALKIIDDSCDEVRNIAHNMMPGALIQMGLVPALEDLFDGINASKVLEVHFISDLKASIGKSKEISVYRIIQEMLNNIIKHAKAKNAYVSIMQEGNTVCIRIKDDGIGMKPEKMKESAGIGWKNIHSRVAMLNGTMEVVSPQGQGLSVEIIIGI